MTATARVAINGLGRIGGLTLRAFHESATKRDLEIVAYNDLTPLQTSAQLLRRDSVHGPFPGEVSVTDSGLLVVNKKEIQSFQESNPKNLPWGDFEIDLVLECTGAFTNREDAQAHIDAGARKVLISAPSKNADFMTVDGVNSDGLSAEHIVVSNASCTTNCLSPVAHAIHNAIGITEGLMVTIHAATNDQKVVDSPHKDLHRARSTLNNIIPTDTGAAGAVGIIIPELNGALNGQSRRVPTSNVSVVEFFFNTARPTSVEEINTAIMQAADNELNGILGYYDDDIDPRVSSDFNHNALSSTVSIRHTEVTRSGKLAHVMAWYDNEWGFSNRMLDTAEKMHKLGYAHS